MTKPRTLCTISIHPTQAPLVMVLFTSVIGKPLAGAIRHHQIRIFRSSDQCRWLAVTDKLRGESLTSLLLIHTYPSDNFFVPYGTICSMFISSSVLYFVVLSLCTSFLCTFYSCPVIVLQRHCEFHISGREFVHFVSAINLLTHSQKLGSDRLRIH